jgi:hypothetical protein
MTRSVVIAVTVILACVVAGGLTAFGRHGDQDKATSLRIGTEYEVVGELYAHEVAADLNARKADFVVLVPLRLSGPEILSRQLVSPGSRVRVLEKTATTWPSVFVPEKYLVEVSTLPKQKAVPIILGLSRGNEGVSTPLNPLIYKPIQ